MFPRRFLLLSELLGCSVEAELGEISISGQHDPAHGLLDKACNIYESNTLKYLDPEILQESGADLAKRQLGPQGHRRQAD
jgi:hypothetical protein